MKIVGKIDPSDLEYTPKRVYEDISEEEFLKELDKSQQSLKSNRIKYIGLKSFVTNILGQKGYFHETSYALANILNEQGVIEIYDIEDELSSWSVKAIRRKRK